MLCQNLFERKKTDKSKLEDQLHKDPESLYSYVGQVASESTAAHQSQQA